MRKPSGLLANTLPVFVCIDILMNVMVRRNYKVNYRCRTDQRTFVKAQSIRWLGHVQRTSEELMPRRMLKGRLFCRRRKGRPRTRWLDNVVMGSEAGEEE